MISVVMGVICTIIYFIIYFGGFIAGCCVAGHYESGYNCYIGYCISGLSPFIANIFASIINSAFNEEYGIDDFFSNMFTSLSSLALFDGIMVFVIGALVCGPFMDYQIVIGIIMTILGFITSFIKPEKQREQEGVFFILVVFVE